MTKHDLPSAARPKRTIPVMYPPGLVQIFHDPRAVGLNADWVMKLLMLPGPKPESAEGWLFLYLGMRAAERK